MKAEDFGIYKMVKVEEDDLYDNVVDGIATFGGILAMVVTRYSTSRIAPVNDTVMKMVLRESGSIALATAAMTMTSVGIKAIGSYLKPYIVK